MHNSERANGGKMNTQGRTASSELEMDPMLDFSEPGPAENVLDP